MSRKVVHLNTSMTRRIMKESHLIFWCLSLIVEAHKADQFEFAERVGPLANNIFVSLMVHLLQNQHTLFIKKQQYLGCLQNHLI